MALSKFTWENGEKVQSAKVEVGGVSYDVTDAQYEGSTPLSASNLNIMQDTLLGNVVDNLSDDTKIPSVKAVKNVYSTTEKVIGIWIDNKPIYRKVVDMGNVPNATSKDVNHNISNMNEIVAMSGIMRNPSNHITTPLNMRGTGGLYGDNTVIIRADREKVSIGCSSNYSSNIAYVILEYTKTTD